jgi:hypothetical protein
MVFFQTSLLAGYGYTHFISTRLKVKSQLFVHGLVLLLPLLLLYGFSLVYYGDIAFFFHAIRGFKPITGGNPIFSALFVLAWVVGLPFIVVATSAPLLQKWFAHTGHPAARDPYFLYGASNLGSFLSLIAYPLVMERMLTLPDQAWVWTVLYSLLVILIFGCVFMVLKAPAQVTLPREKEVKEPAAKEKELAVVGEKKEEVGVKAGAPPAERASSFKKGAKQFRKGQKEGRKSLTERREEPTHMPPPSIQRPSHDPRLSPVTPLRRMRWIALAAIPSSLMLGVTTYATTDLSPIPLLWLIPLMLYLLSFILVFSKWPTVWVEKPHDIFVLIQPFTIGALILMLVLSKFSHGIFAPIAIHMIAFFVTTMVCHGELAKDRPSTEHLTEFYLLMSVGGMLGGMFNGLVAPILFIYVIEYGLAIFFSALMRPQMAAVSWMDQYFEGLFGPADGRGKRERSGAADYPLILDFALPIVGLILMAGLTFLLGGPVMSLFKNVMGIAAQGGEAVPFLIFVFGMGVLISLLFMERPLRYGLMIGGILLVQSLYEPPGYSSESLLQDRSYFGVIRVRVGHDMGGLPYTNMIHGTTDHGMNFRRPESAKDWGNSDKDFSRLATTYYHRKGPAGRVMELYNWFPGPMNTYWADARMPATLIGLGATPMPWTSFQSDMALGLWTEPPYATIGLGTGTMASYARPFQHMHYYEIDKHVLRLSVPGATAPFYKGHPHEPLFTYLRDAKERGADLWVMMGDARLRMAQPFSGKDDFSDWTTDVANKYYSHEVTVQEYDRDSDKLLPQSKKNLMVVDGDVGGGPDNFYHMMVVDAFSSDAIPVHLITEEAIKMYFTKLREDGILCVHTSNKYVNLVPVVADVAKALGYVAWRGHDSAPGKATHAAEERGHYTSEWVMVARKQDYLSKRLDFPNGKVGEKGEVDPRVLDVLQPPPNYEAYLKEDYLKQGLDFSRAEKYWSPAQSKGWPTWTDNYSNVIIAIRWPGSSE